MAPLAFAGAGLATVTLSACYGVPCAATNVHLPDGGTKTETDSLSCGGSYDCNKSEDGGTPVMDAEWNRLCK